MNEIKNLLKHTPEIETKLGYAFQDKSLLFTAFVHRSFANESREIREHNERLEFLGDSILGFIMAEFLYRELPDKPEGDLSNLRSKLVEANSCSLFVKQLGLENFLLLGKGERMTPGRGRDTILADFFEAIIGAIYLDGGIVAAKNFIFSCFMETIRTLIAAPLKNWKASLQDFCQKHHKKAPTYTVLSETGPEHGKSFKIEVSVGGQILGIGEGSSKKAAQQSAAEAAMMLLTPQATDPSHGA